MSWTTPLSWATNDSLTAATLNTQLRDNQSFLYSPPSCGLSISGPEAHTSSGSWTSVGFDVEDWDNDGMFTVSSNSRITMATAGRYLIVGYIDWASNATGNRGARIVTNGTAVRAAQSQPAAAAAAGLSVTAVLAFAAGSYVELQAFQSSGGTLNLNPATLTATWIGN